MFKDLIATRSQDSSLTEELKFSRDGGSKENRGEYSNKAAILSLMAQLPKQQDE